MNLPTHETRGARYVALLRERFGPDAADRVTAEPCDCAETFQGVGLPEGSHWPGCHAERAAA